MKFATLAAFLIGASSAEAGVVTLVGANGVFTGSPPIGDPGAYIQMEQLGFIYDQGGGVSGQLIFLSDDGPYNTASYVFRTDGKRFSLLSGVARVGGRIQRSADTAAPVRSDYDGDSAFMDDYFNWANGGEVGEFPPLPASLQWQGYREGLLVASWVAPQYGWDGRFGVEFTNLDAITVTANRVGSFSMYFYDYKPIAGLEPGGFWCTEFCFDAAVKSLTLDLIDPPVPVPAPIPLPAGLPLLAAGLGLLGLAGCRRRIS